MTHDQFEPRHDFRPSALASSLAGTPHGGGYPAHRPVRGHRECGNWFERLNIELHRRGVKVAGHMNVKFLAGDPDSAEGPRGFFKFYGGQWDEKLPGPPLRASAFVRPSLNLPPTVAGRWASTPPSKILKPGAKSCAATIFYRETKRCIARTVHDAEVLLLYPRSRVHEGDVAAVARFKELGKRLLDETRNITPLALSGTAPWARHLCRNEAKTIFSPIGAACSGNYSRMFARTMALLTELGNSFALVLQGCRPNGAERQSAGNFFSSASPWVKVSPDTAVGRKDGGTYRCNATCKPSQPTIASAP